MSTFILMRGISGSGKSYCARQLQDEYGHVVVSRDDLRLALFGVAFGPPIDENYITEVEFKAIEAALRKSLTVISDNTNLTPKMVRERFRLAYSLGASIRLHEVEADLATALENNRKRGASGGRFVPEHVISSQAHSFTQHRSEVQDIYERALLGLNP